MAAIECRLTDYSCWWNRFMHSNTTNEIAVGTTGILFSIVAFDDPTLRWLDANWITLGIVTGMTMAVAGVTCILSPAPSPRMTLGRILASGIFGAVVTVIAGALHSSGNGPAAIAAIVLICGIGGWMIWMGLLEYATAMRESASFKKSFGVAMWNVVLRIFNVPRTPVNGANMPPLPPADANGKPAKIDSKEFAAHFDKVMERRKEIEVHVREKMEAKAKTDAPTPTPPAGESKPD